MSADPDLLQQFTHFITNLSVIDKNDRNLLDFNYMDELINQILQCTIAKECSSTFHTNRRLLQTDTPFDRAAIAGNSNPDNDVTGAEQNRAMYENLRAISVVQNMLTSDGGKMEAPTNFHLVEPSFCYAIKKSAST